MVEVQFYLLLPLLHAIARAPRLRWLLWPILIAGCALYLLYTNRLPWKPAQFYFIVNPRDSILCLWPVFFLGGALAWLHANYRAQMIRYAAASRFLVNGGADLLFFALLLALANELLAVARMGPWAANGFNFDHIAIEGALWTLLIAAVLYLPLKTRRLWCNPLFAFFGAISYSLYLLHSCTMNLGWHFIRNGNIGELAASKPLSIALLLGIALLLSILTYALIEKPALDLKHRVGARR
jgi:peptidoglycan/LPS O-acetylase OafA/YrhL